MLLSAIYQTTLTGKSDASRQHGISADWKLSLPVETKENEMADNLSDRGARDRARIDVNQRHELQYWSKKFGVTEDELRKAVEQVGPMADKVGERLGKKAS